MQTSEEGVEFLERHEGVVLKAYRDPVGILTIGAGLTKASGVIVPKPGMTITKKQASALLAQSLRRNYEPAVAKAMPSASQYEFDGAVSFHFNTGAIHRASWVKAWRKRDWAETERRIRMWKKAGGRVLPGLVRRRHEEFRLIRVGEYDISPAKVPNSAWQATFALRVDQHEITEIRAALRQLGYDPGPTAGQIERAAVRKFQHEHDLTVDGIIGRATLSTLQRRIDAAKKANGTAATTAVCTGGGGTAAAVTPEVAAWIVGGSLAFGGIIALYLAWTYRDVVAAKVEKRLPKLAKKLRSL